MGGGETAGTVWSRELTAASGELRGGFRVSGAQGSLGDQIGREIVTRADLLNREGRTEFSMRLEPPELGTVRIHLTATDNTLAARFVVDNEAVRQVVANQMDSLRQSLADAGMSLQRFDVSHGGNQSGGDERFQRETWQPPIQHDAAPYTRRPVSPRSLQTQLARGRIDVVV
jgi:flagellar hook-length control protein FliK